jgi:catechol 2,3-dioxygenase-like lactoylglutathione lyase family enzyme/uncharacterized damage-inducible protein DinB
MPAGQREEEETMTSPEAWLRGPVDGVPDVLQPIAHALIQAREESRRLLQSFPAELLWTRPAGLASVGFHLQHITGVVDRLFTYARGESLSREQQATLAHEGDQSAGGGVDELLDTLDAQVERAVDQLRALQPRTLNEPRAVGRKQLPSTVMGLLFHAAEHAQRHVGQLLVTARVQQQHPTPSPVVTRMLETALYVDDLDGAVAFYRDVLALRVLNASDRLVSMDAGQATVLLLFRRGATVSGLNFPCGWIPPHDGQGPVHLAFAIAAEALEPWVRRLEERGIAIESRVRWERGGQSIYFRDPAGHSVELATPGTWAVY